ncbi:MAG: tyrosine-type recombinase/integrase [Bacillota bacterium]|nr:tyrosine-type recombinase/integrase [Bacillota bacterium]
MANKPKINASAKGKNYFRVRTFIGYDDKGEYVYKNFYGTSKSDAENKRNAYLKEIESGLNPDLTSQSLSQAMNTWLWNIEKYSGNKSSSFERYESIYRNYVRDAGIGLLKMSDIKKLAIQKYYNSLMDAGKSYSQISNLHKLLNKFFGYAEMEGYIIKNPCKGLKIPKDDEDEIEEEDKVIETFDNDEIKTLVESIGNKKLKYIVIFALLTGLRQGEILALDRKDIINDKSIVRVNKTLRSVKTFGEDGKNHYELKTTKPKSRTSRREVPLPAALKVELRKLEILVAEEKLRLGEAYTSNSLLFPSETGTYIDAKNLRRSWKRALENANIPYRKFHALRHTYATRLFENNTSILTVSRLLGHSSIKTTEIYTHVLEDVKTKEVECLNAIFN